MKVSTKGRYALRIMMDIAENSSDNYVTLKEISERQNITVKYLEQIISFLGKKGLVEGIRGNGGGYKLTKRPKDYTAGEIIRAAEGDLCPVDCIYGESECEMYKDCKASRFWNGFCKAIDDYVDGVSLEDLIAPVKKTSREPSVWIL